MGLIGGQLGYRMLRAISPGERTGMMDGSAFADRSKLRVLLGDDVFELVRGKVVLDFGCGEGAEAIEIVRAGAVRVIALDIQERLLQEGRRQAAALGMADRIAFVQQATEPVDVVISLDSFEHFADPAAVLRTMHALLLPGGQVLTSFGPTWYHPLGGHLFSIFPWAHLVFTERALIRWRAGFKTDGATRFSEVAGGLNQMTIGRFERLVAASPLRLVDLEAVPIRRLRRLATRVTREFTTAVVRARLVRES